MRIFRDTALAVRVCLFPYGAVSAKDKLKLGSNLALALYLLANVLDTTFSAVYSRAQMGGVVCLSFAENLVPLRMLGVKGVLSHNARQIVVKTIVFLITLITTTVAWPTRAAEKSPITSSEMSTNNSPEAIAAAKNRGQETATKDIKAGELRILYFGKPWSASKPLVDETTGYRVQIVGGCCVSEAFVAEVAAYNATMRDRHAKTKKATPSQKR
ncbi:MAG: hypothetical protein WC740_08600 [Verrucomicrobiia bacterium]